MVLGTSALSGRCFGKAHQTPRLSPRGCTSEGIGALGTPHPSSTHSPDPDLLDTASREIRPQQPVSAGHPLSDHSPPRLKSCQTHVSCHYTPRPVVSGKEPGWQVPDTGNNFASSSGFCPKGALPLHLQASSLGTQDFKSKVLQKLP